LQIKWYYKKKCKDEMSRACSTHGEEDGYTSTIPMGKARRGTTRKTMT
jgi:hypothetical protein